MGFMSVVAAPERHYARRSNVVGHEPAHVRVGSGIVASGFSGGLGPARVGNRPKSVAKCAAMGSNHRMCTAHLHR